MKWYKVGWLAVILTMMYRYISPNISSCCKECTNLQYTKHFNTCTNIHYLIILSFTLILIAAIRYKIWQVYKLAFPPLFECFFFPIWNLFFFKVWFVCLFFKMQSSRQRYFLFSKDHISVNLTFTYKLDHLASQIQTYVKRVIKWHYYVWNREEK